MDDKYVMISERIRELREIFEFSVEDMAIETGVDVSAYVEYEASGKNIPISVLYHISNKFGVDLSEILTGEPARISTLQVSGSLKDKSRQPLFLLKSQHFIL